MRRTFGYRRTLVSGMMLASVAACGSTVGAGQYPTVSGGSQTDLSGGLGAEVLSAPTVGTPNAAGESAAPTSTGSISDGSEEPFAGPPATSSESPHGSATSAASASVPATGPGWDAKNLYIGVPTENDVATAATALGIKNVYIGDLEGDVNAVVEEINAKGGILGRKLVPVFHDNSTASLLSDPNSVGQNNCTYFTQDRRVAAVVNLLALMDVDSFRACMGKAKVPVFAAGQLTDDQALSELQGLYLNASASWNSYVKILTQRLTAQNFFSGWDITTGRAASSAPKIGLLVYVATPTTKRIGNLFKVALQASGHPAVATFEYSDVLGSEMRSAVLKFRSAGVTHVFDYTAAVAQFMTNAQQQGYHPRYALVSTMGPRDVIAAQAPAAQLVGSQGTGFCPVCEVPDARDPHQSPGAASCQAALAKGGIRYQGEGKRSALGIAYAYCDGIKLFAAGFRQGEGSHHKP